MSDCLCPSCRYPNRPTARRCAACGAGLVEGDTVPSPLMAYPADEAGVDWQVSALWFDDLGLSTTVPRTSGDVVPRLPDITVREMRFTSRAPEATRSSPADDSDDGSLPLPLLPAQFQPQPQAQFATPAPANPLPLAATLPTDRAARTAIKVARRAAVRRDRQESASPLQAVSDVLVMDGDGAARSRLDELLGEFGFRVRPVATLAQAALLVGHHPFAAVIVAVPPGAIDGAVHDLFERAREVSERAAVPPAVCVLLAPQWSPMDRVRAELAGCEATLAGPVSRRDLARVLDANGVVLPRDPRRV